MNRGVQAFKSAQYREAVDAFQHAVSLEPSNVNGHLYLGTAYMTQWVPGAHSAENDDVANKAQTEFEAALTIDPRNSVALASLASLAYQMTAGEGDPSAAGPKLDQAAKWNRRIVEVDPGNKEAYYSLGLIAWRRYYPALNEARARLGMRPADPGPLTDANARRELQERFGQVIEDGIQNLNRAIEIDASYDDAMAYLNLLIRERADLRDSKEEYLRDVQVADQWVARALEAKKSKGMMPPPPLGVKGAPGSAPQRIRVGANVQAANLITRVEPVYPPLAQQARVQGTVRFQVVIGKDGRISAVQLLSGHPLLVTSATEAVRQWVYKPTLLNGEPVEVQTEISVTFAQ